MNRTNEVERLVEELQDISRHHTNEMARLSKERDGIVRDAVHRIEALEVEAMKKRVASPT
ncbi:hypothetical protein L0Y59_02085 [Candidatus Uhrbacteria bacterium]|nr:hypothetical protein [Candidatus Uhrbacteria bacterium]